jgi:hypothetical protein
MWQFFQRNVSSILGRPEHLPFARKVPSSLAATAAGQRLLVHLSVLTSFRTIHCADNEVTML